MTTDTTKVADAISGMNPDTFNWADSNAYASLGIGEPGEDPQGDEDDGHIPQEGDTAAAPTPAPAAAPAQAPAAAAPAPVAATESSAAPAAASAPATGEAVDGVATRDGKSIIPYAVLQNTRRENQLLREELARAQAAKAPAADDPATRAANPESLTPAELEELATDFPQLAKPLKIIQQAQESIAQLKAAPTPAATPAAAPKQGNDEVSEDEAFDRGIIANPLLASWMSAGGKEWERAKAVDRLLSNDPETAKLSFTDRFAKVQRMVAAEFDIPLPTAAKPANTPAAAPVAAPAAAPLPQPKAAALPSLSDLGGSTPQSDEDATNSMTTTDLLAKAERLSDAELLRMAGVSY